MKSRSERFREDLVEQLELLELQLRVARLFVVDAQERAYFRECRTAKPFGCWACKTKRFILRGRFQ